MRAVALPVRRCRLLHGAQRPRQKLPAVEAQQPAWYGRSSKPVRACLFIGEQHAPFDFGIVDHGIGHSAGLAAAESFPAGVQSCVTWRSEEHTSELQSLMRISYAVFCLKKKKQIIAKT